METESKDSLVVRYWFLVETYKELIWQLTSECYLLLIVQNPSSNVVNPTPKTIKVGALLPALGKPGGTVVAVADEVGEREGVGEEVGVSVGIIVGVLVGVDDNSATEIAKLGNLNWSEIGG